MSLDHTKAIVRDAATAIFGTFSARDVERLLAEHYIQHNPGVPSGRAPIVGFLPALQQSGIRVELHRVIAEGNLVVMHVTYHNAQLFGGETLVGFDVFRVDGEQVVEHWDNLMPKLGPNPSGRLQTDGPTAIEDRERTASNKALVRSFIESVLIGGAFERLGEFISQTTYHQHNPGIGDGLDGLGAAVAAMAQQGISMRYDTLHAVVAEGNFVFAMSEGALGAAHTAFYDLFRIERGRIVEHWDVIADIPVDMAHSNGKFGAVTHTV